MRPSSLTSSPLRSVPQLPIKTLKESLQIKITFTSTWLLQLNTSLPKVSSNTPKVSKTTNLVSFSPLNRTRRLRRPHSFSTCCLNSPPTFLNCPWKHLKQTALSSDFICFSGRYSIWQNLEETTMIKPRNRLWSSLTYWSNSPILHSKSRLIRSFSSITVCIPNPESSHSLLRSSLTFAWEKIAVTFSLTEPDKL